jgi:hypothetical protein
MTSSTENKVVEQHVLRKLNNGVDTFKEGFARFCVQHELKTGKNGDQHLNLGYDGQFDKMPKFEIEVSSGFGISPNKGNDDEGGSDKKKNAKNKKKADDSESDDEETAARKKKAKAEKEAKGESKDKNEKKGFQIGWPVAANKWESTTKQHDEVSIRLATDAKKVIWPEDEDKANMPAAFLRKMGKKPKDKAKADKYGLSVTISCAPNCVFYQEYLPLPGGTKNRIKLVKPEEIQKKPGKFFIQGYYQKLVLKDFYNVKPVAEIIIRRPDTMREAPQLMTGGDYETFVDEPVVKKEEPKKEETKTETPKETKVEEKKEEVKVDNPIVSVTTTTESSTSEESKSDKKRKRDDDNDEDGAKKEKKRRRKAAEDA